MFKHKAILTIALLVVLILLLSIIPAASSQTTAAAQRWEYALLIYDTSESTAVWRVSTLYDSLQIEFPISHETTQAAWDLVTENDGGLADYLGVMGISGYELAAVTSLANSDMIYTFKRPIPN